MTESSATVIYLLVGPKGAGKTYLGVRMERELGMTFVRVEPIWLQVAREIGADAPDFDECGQQRVLDAIQIELPQGFSIVLESTGTAPWFGVFLAKLGQLAEVRPVRVTAPAELCIDRVRTRDRSQHIAVSDDDVALINRIAAGVELPWYYEVENGTPSDASRFIERLRQGGDPDTEVETRSR